MSVKSVSSCVVGLFALNEHEVTLQNVWQNMLVIYPLSFS